MVVVPEYVGESDFDVSVGPEGVARRTADLATFELLRRWSDWMEVSGRYAETTRHQYRRAMIAFLSDVILPLDEIEETDVVDYLEDQRGRGRTRGDVIRAAHCFYRWALRRELLEYNPFAYIDLPPDPEPGDAPFLSPDELERVLQAAEGLDLRARPTLELMYATGARVGSLCAVMPDDDLHLEGCLEDHGAHIHFRVAKGDRPYRNPLGPRGIAAATRLLELRDHVPHHAVGRRPTLVGVNRSIVQRWASLAGEMVGLHVWSHLFRHTFCERIVNDPAVPDIVAASLMNHKDTKLLKRYGHAREALKREAVTPL